ncbi:MAG: LysM peptidoglycan-binding domain-containing protein [Acidobacteria bacterium]|nr:LysM peptidoglycan-binding domain-containing protein [Acidobacteriota bacterium]
MMVRNLHTVLVVIGLLLAVGCATRTRQPMALIPPSPRLTPPEPPSLLPAYRLPAAPDLALIAHPKYDPVLDVIENAQAAFERGQQEYRTGHLEMAKKEFNHAITVILKSPVTADEDKRLQAEFDKLVERIYAYEVEALRQGDGFAEPPYQPAPIDQLQTLTFPEDPQLSEQVRKDAARTVSEIPLVTNAQVASYIKYFTDGRGRSTLEATLGRSGRFRDMIFRILEEEQVPQELFYLAQAESGFQPRARSTKSALGLWQFMASRGKEYGLDRNWWVDERMNPEQATRAAARHLRDLYTQFGDWYLAMAAYNCGPMCVQRAVERTGYADFWELARRKVLPAQTRNYVPLIIALTIIGKNPEKYGIEDLPLEPAWSYDSVAVTSPIDLRLVAEMTNTSLETIRRLNPNLLRTTTPKVPQYTLRIPLATREIFQKRVEMIPPEKRVFWRWHTVRYGESLTSIAKEFKTSVKAIAEVNNLDPVQPLYEAAELVIPVGGNQAAGSLEPLAAPGERHLVARGDTLSSIARRYNVSIEAVMAWNLLDDTVIQAGQRLLVAPLDPPEGNSAAPGAAQNASPAKPPARQIATTSALRATTSSQPVAKTPSTETGRLIHRVRKGESLSLIASAYKTSVQDLIKNNGHLGKILQVGDPVYIPPSKK